MPLTVATCQFPLSADIAANCRQIIKQMRDACERGADVAHFPEGALSGYAGADFDSFQDFAWKQLKKSTETVMRQAGELGLWVVLGSAHRLTGKHKPHNSLYIINDRGEIVDRYDKMFCAGNREETAGDLAHFSPGSKFCTFEINGVRCGTLICHEYRYPELFREYRRRQVQVLFHSFHAGNVGAKQLNFMRNQVGAENHVFNPGTTLPEITMPAGMHSAAADNYLWISCSNTSARESCWASFIVRPDGVCVGRLRRNVAGVLCTSVDPTTEYYDSTALWRDRAMRGVFHTGRIAKDKRSDDRTSL